MKGTIKSKEKIGWLFAQGSRYQGVGFLALYAKPEIMPSSNDADKLGKTAYVAGKKLGSAPKRNQAKRRLREAVRMAGVSWNSHDVVLVAVKGTLRADFKDIVASVEKLGLLLSQSERTEAEPNKETEPSLPAAAKPSQKTAKPGVNRTFAAFLVGIPRQLAIVCIKIYRHAISPLLPPSCRFVPTCSEYALTALERFGFWRGSWLAIKRIGRCHPFNPGGYDPVPQRSSNKLA